MDIKFNDENKNKKGKLIVLLVINILLLSFGLLAINKDNYNNSDDCFYNTEVEEEVIRYAKNLERFYIYFEGFDANTAYEKIKGLKDELYEIKTNAIENNQKAENSTEATSIEETEIQDNSISETDENKYQLNVKTSDTEINYEIYDDTDYDSNESYLEKDILNVSPASYLSLNVKDYSYSKKEEYVKNLSELLKNYQEIKSYLSRNTDFKYNITRSNGEKYTNSDNFEKEEGIGSVNINDDIFKDVIFNGESLADYFNQNNMNCQIIVPKSVLNDTKSDIYNAIKYNEYLKRTDKYLNIFSKTALIIAILGFAILIKNYKTELIELNNNAYNKYIYLPLLAKLLIMLFCFNFFTRFYIISEAIYNSRYYEIGLNALIMALAIVLTVLFIEFILKAVRKPSSLKNELEVRYIIKQFKNIKLIMKTNNFFLLIIYLIIAISIIGATVLYLLVFTATELGAIVIFGLFYLIGLYIAIKLLGYINSYVTLCYYIDELSKGNIKEIPTEKSAFMKPLNNLSRINESVKVSVENAIRNERLKTELITNVSHDLKTPLTSIINYVELLKGLKLENKTANEYIDVIDKKSIRLKVLIEDLFEASKLSTGQMKLEKNILNVSELLNQCLGELESKIKNKGIDFKLNIPENPVMAEIDGERMWRVFDNLINNIIKYSPANSRAYIDLTEEKDKIIIAFKNTSENELSFKASELFERFKRGDSSRSTEGSGLGLSIAKSIVELHGGLINIVIDGDLFKVVVELKKIEE